MTSTQPSLQKSVFLPSVLLTLALGVSFVMWPEATATWANGARGWITHQFVWLYLLAGVAAIIFSLWLAFGRYGHIKLGDKDAPVEYSNLHWVAMMFTAGIGAGIVAWGFAEPIYYLQTPPFGIEVGSPKAYEWAHMYPLFHWGFVPWAFYALPAVPIAYNLYVRKIPFLRVSESCHDGLPETGRDTVKILIDIFILLGIIGGTTTSLGLGVPLVSALLTELTGLENSIFIKAGVLLIFVLLFGASTLRGLKRGIRLLADFNMGLAVLLLLIILLIGPTLFILKMSVNSLGLMADNIVRMVLWSDPIENSGFPEDWTVFYWAWWMAFAAFVGLFIARISKGRTIRQLTLGTLIWGSLGTMTYMSIAGAYALHLNLNEILPLGDILAANDLYVMTAKIAANLPFGQISLVFFIVLCIVFYATSMDSAAFIAAGVCSKNLHADQEPQLKARVAWIAIIFLMTLGVVLSDNLGTVQAMTVIGSLPLIPILFIMCVSLLRQLREDQEKQDG